MCANNIRELAKEILLGSAGSLIVAYACGLLFGTVGIGSIYCPSWIPPPIGF